MRNHMSRSLLVAIVTFTGAACTDSESVQPAAGGSVDLELDHASGNVDTDPQPATDIGIVFANPATHTRVIGAFAYETAGDGVQRKLWHLALTISGDPVPGATYAIGTTAAA